MQIYQTHEDQACPVGGVAAAKALAAFYGVGTDPRCVPGDRATFSNGTRVPYCDKKQPLWSAYRCAVPSVLLLCTARVVVNTSDFASRKHMCRGDPVPF